MNEFSGRRVVVTGAGRGVGRGIAELFAAQGAHVMIGARTLAFGEVTRDAIRKAGGVAELTAFEAKSRQSCQELIDAAAAAFGGLDVVIHCAADIPHGGLGRVSDAAMEAGFASIAKAAWWLLDAARPHLSAAQTGGRFIAVGSVNGTSATVPNMTAYGMAKAALDAFVRGAAGDVVQENITVNAVNPGFIASDNAKRVLGDEGLAAYGAAVPVGRAGTPADVAHACLYFASMHAGYCTGASLRLDGGASVAARSTEAAKLLAARIKAQTET
jgi:3-oxoacyl-[acyl-carrier protein] reductase